MHTNRKKLNRYEKNQQGYGLKKHVKHMNELEKEFLMRQFRAVGKTEWTFTPHALEQFENKGVDPTHFLTIFEAESQLIEYHKKNGSNRILLRGKTTDSKGYQACVVFAPEDKSIVTVWLNHCTNQHQKLKEEFYDENIDVLKQYKGGK